MERIFLDVCGVFERNERTAAFVAQEMGLTLVRELLGEPKGWKLEVGLMEEEFGTIDIGTVPTVSLIPDEQDELASYRYEDNPDSYVEHANVIIANLNECINWSTIADLALEYERCSENGVYIDQSDVED